MHRMLDGTLCPFQMQCNISNPCAFFLFLIDNPQSKQDSYPRKMNRVTKRRKEIARTSVFPSVLKECLSVHWLHGEMTPTIFPAEFQYTQAILLSTHYEILILPHTQILSLSTAKILQSKKCTFSTAIFLWMSWGRGFFIYFRGNNSC